MKTIIEAAKEYVTEQYYNCEVAPTFDKMVTENDFIAGAKIGAEIMYQTAISCSVGHDISSQDTMFVIDHFAFTEAYNKLIKEL